MGRPFTPLGFPATFGRAEAPWRRRASAREHSAEVVISSWRQQSVEHGRLKHAGDSSRSAVPDLVSTVSDLLRKLK
eukprot:7453422-Pyramimonas_sp.AAC.1